jgi:hypothetical protein
MRSENPGAVVSGALPRLESLAKAAGTHHHTERAGGRGARTRCGAALRMGAVGERERYLVLCAGGERPLKERFVSHRRRFGQGARCPGSKVPITKAHQMEEAGQRIIAQVEAEQQEVDESIQSTRPLR